MRTFTTTLIKQIGCSATFETLLHFRSGQVQGQEGEEEGEETASQVEEGRAEGAGERLLGNGRDGGDEEQVRTRPARGGRVQRPEEAETKIRGGKSCL